MKRFLAFLLALMLTFTLAACGEDTGKTPPGTTDPGTQQTDPGIDESDNQDGSEQTNTPNPSNNNTSLEAPWFGWTEEDIKPDTGFASIESADGKGWFISLTEPLTEDTYKAWYAKIVSKIEGFADNGEYDMGNITDLDAALTEAINTFNAGGGAIYIPFEYQIGDMKINVITMATNLEDTDEVLYFQLIEVE